MVGKKTANSNREEISSIKIPRMSLMNQQSPFIKALGELYNMRLNGNEIKKVRKLVKMVDGKCTELSEIRLKMAENLGAEIVEEGGMKRTVFCGDDKKADVKAELTKAEIKGQEDKKSYEEELNKFFSDDEDLEIPKYKIRLKAEIERTAAFEDALDCAVTFI